jgi:hypothetical protein
LRTCEIVEGNFPSRQTKLVLAWAELHKDDLAVSVPAAAELFAGSVSIKKEISRQDL